MLKERKKVELEDLARMVKQGFDEVHNRFKKMDERFEKIDGKFKEADLRFDSIDNKLVNLDRRLDVFVTHEKRLVKVERELGFAV